MSSSRTAQHILLRSLSKALIARIALCSVVLVALLELLAMLDQLSPILARHLGLRGILTYTTLHMPALIVEIMPLSVLIGTLFLLTRMALSSEISALRAAGLSTSGLYRLLLPVALTAGILTAIGQYWIVPSTERALATWWNQTDPTAVSTQVADHILWFRSGPTLIRVGHIAQGGMLLRDVTLYHRDSEGLLTSMEHADTLTSHPDGWSATPALNTTLSPDKSTAHVKTSAPAFQIPASPAQIMTLTFPQPLHTPGQLLNILYRAGPASLPRTAYRMSLFAGLFLPLEMAVMVLVSLPVIYIPPRAGLRNPLPVYALAVGLGYITLQGMIAALGNAGTLPALFATSAGPLLGMLIGLSWLVRMEGR